MKIYFAIRHKTNKSLYYDDRSIYDEADKDTILRGSERSVTSKLNDINRKLRLSIQGYEKEKSNGTMRISDASLEELKSELNTGEVVPVTLSLKELVITVQLLEDNAE